MHFNVFPIHRITKRRQLSYPTSATEAHVSRLDAKCYQHWRHRFHLSEKITTPGIPSSSRPAPPVVPFRCDVLEKKRHNYDVISTFSSRFPPDIATPAPCARGNCDRRPQSPLCAVFGFHSPTENGTKENCWASDRFFRFSSPSLSLHLSHSLVVSIWRTLNTVSSSSSHTHLLGIVTLSRTSFHTHTIESSHWGVDLFPILSRAPVWCVKFARISPPLFMIRCQS